MYDLYVRDILKICSGLLLFGSENIKLGKFCTDTRVIEKGDVFVAIVGEQFDGNDFYQDAIDKGASVCIVSKKVNIDGKCCIVLVDDTLKCLQSLAKYKRSLMDIPVVAITGSVGKTSTKDMIASVISSKYSVHKTSGNFNNHIGVPLTVLNYSNEEVLIVEMGMNHLKEISFLTDIAKPTVAVITNVGTAHIGNLGSRENILKAKLEILDSMSVNDVVINVDNDMLASVEDKLREDYRVKTVSIDSNSDYRAINIDEEVFSSKFDIDRISKGVIVNVGGKVFVYNALMAYAVGDILCIDDKDIKKGIKNFKLSSHRLEKKVSKSGITIIDDTYNANFDSMKASLELLGKVKKGRKIAILGDMLELGKYTKKMHEDLGNIVLENRIDILVTVGKDSDKIGKKAIELGMKEENIIHFDKESDTYEYLSNLLKKQDVVLLKGSHGIHLECVVNEIMKL